MINSERIEQIQKKYESSTRIFCLFHSVGMKVAGNKSGFVDDKTDQ